MLVSGLINGATIGDKFAPFMFGIVLFCSYLVARIFGKDIYKLFVPAIIIETISIIVYSFTHSFAPNGGLLSPTNYDIACGLLIIGAIVSYSQRQWIWCGIAALGVLFTGAPEGYFAIVVLLIAILVRKDWSKKLLYITIPLACIVMFAAFTELSHYTYWTANLINDAPQHMADGTYYENTFTGRIRVIGESLQDFKLFGNGYTITEFSPQTVHNVPLVIVQQVGIFAALAWLFVTFYMVIKSKWKYIWIIIICLSIFDHYLWTQVAPWWWVILGTTSIAPIENDYIFKSKSVDNVKSNVGVAYKLEPKDVG
jgi:hypothetical protein